MDLKEAIRARHSVRQYTDKEIDEETLFRVYGTLRKILRREKLYRADLLQSSICLYGRIW